MLNYFTLPLLLLLGVSSGNSQFPETSSKAGTGTLEKMIIASGNVAMDLDLKRLNGVVFATKESMLNTLRFEAVPNSFFKILVFNNALRGPEPGSLSGNTMTVNVTGVADVQQLTVTLSTVTDTFAQVLPDTPVSANMLIGDTNGNKTVNATDVAHTKAQSGLPVNAANFRTDVNASGTITASDIAQVKTNTGHTVP